MKIMLTEQDKQEIRFACIAVDIDGTASPAVIEWMSACAELPADTEAEMPPYPGLKDLGDCAVTSREAAYSGMRSLSGMLEQQRVVRAARAASLTETDSDYVYDIAHDGRVVEHLITKWTPKRVYYVRERLRYRDRQVVEYMTSPDRRWSDTRSWVERDGDAIIWVIIDHANRAELERNGEAATLTGYPYPQHVVFATREAAEAIAAGDIKQLRRLMADAHPDRGGTNEGFMAARKRYEQALWRVS